MEPMGRHTLAQIPRFAPAPPLSRNRSCVSLVLKALRFRAWGQGHRQITTHILLPGEENSEALKHEPEIHSTKTCKPRTGDIA